MKEASVGRLTTGTQFPYLSLFIGIVVLIIFCLNNAGSHLQYDRAGIVAGEFWRLITSHWTHWSFEHFLWCSITFFALGIICERLNRKGFVISLALSAIAIPAFCWFVDPAMLLYRGLSGLCSSVFAVACVLMARKARAEHDKMGMIIPACAGLLFFAKVIFEFISGQTIFVHSSDIFVPVPLVHLVGSIAGVITGTFVGFQTEP